MQKKVLFQQNFAGRSYSQQLVVGFVKNKSCDFNLFES